MVGRRRGTRERKAMFANMKGMTNRTYKKHLMPFSDADKDGVKNIYDCKPFDKTKQDDKIEVYGNNFSMESKGKGKFNLSLGNRTTAGWFWEGNQNDLVGFFARLGSSKVMSEFIKTFKEEGVNFVALKPFLIKAANKKDGLYELSGDNVKWHFGETSDSESEILRDFDVPEEVFWNDYSGSGAVNYDKFEKEYGNDYKEDVNRIIGSSNSAEDFIDELNDFKREVIEWGEQFSDDHVRGEAQRIETKWRKEQGLPK